MRPHTKLKRKGKDKEEEGYPIASKPFFIEHGLSYQTILEKIRSQEFQTWPKKTKYQALQVKNRDWAEDWPEDIFSHKDESIMHALASRGELSLADFSEFSHKEQLHLFLLTGIRSPAHCCVLFGNPEQLPKLPTPLLKTLFNSLDLKGSSVLYYLAKHNKVTQEHSSLLDLENLLLPGENYDTALEWMISHKQAHLIPKELFLYGVLTTRTPTWGQSEGENAFGLRTGQSRTLAHYLARMGQLDQVPSENLIAPLFFEKDEKGRIILDWIPKENLKPLRHLLPEVQKTLLKNPKTPPHILEFLEKEKMRRTVLKLQTPTAPPYTLCHAHPTTPAAHL